MTSSDHPSVGSFGTHSAEAEVPSYRIQVRYYAGAAAAAGIDEEFLTFRGTTSLRDAVQEVSDRHPDLALVLAASSFFINEVTATDSALLHSGDILDILPPFAGG